MKSLDSRLSSAERQQDELEEETQPKESGLVRLTGLWLSKDKAGEKYLSGTVSPSSRLLVLANGHKQKASDPDYIAYLAPAERQQEQQTKRSGL